VIAWRDRGLTSGLSSYGYLFFFIGAVVIAVLSTEAKVTLVFSGTLLFGALFCRDALSLFRRWQLWVFILSAFLLAPFVIGEKDISLWVLRLSQEGLWTGLWMTLRALTIALAATTFATVVSAPQMAQLFERMGLKGLGFALGVATNMLPTIQETAGTAYHALRLRGGFRRRRLETLRLLLVAIIAGSLRRGDDIVCAAEARAFDPTRSPGPPLRVAPADLALLAILSLLGAGLLMV
jgi:energy-coupling factor transporter transmembrane protein EcfT